MRITIYFFQVALSLVLLYQQVGLAFLAGVAFAVILIPINRWLAIKICHLSTEMMTQKDTRVNVGLLSSPRTSIIQLITTLCSAY